MMLQEKRMFLWQRYLGSERQCKCKPVTRKKVLDVINQLGYRPNAVARGLASKRTTTVGVIIPDISNVFYAELARGLKILRQCINTTLSSAIRTKMRIKNFKYLTRFLVNKWTELFTWANVFQNNYKKNLTVLQHQ